MTFFVHVLNRGHILEHQVKMEPVEVPQHAQCDDQKHELNLNYDIMICFVIGMVEIPATSLCRSSN